MCKLTCHMFGGGPWNMWKRVYECEVEQYDINV